jgi:hypothetical protein
MDQTLLEIREGLYDTYTAAKSAVLPLSIRLFTSGQNATKGIESTNMTADGELQNPEEMDIYTVQVELMAMAQADMLAFVQKYVARLVVSGVSRLTRPITLLPSGGGIVGATELSKNGIADARAVFTIPEDLKIQIQAGQKFYFEFVSTQGYTLTDTTLGMVARVTLDGIHGVQNGVAA